MQHRYDLIKDGYEISVIWHRKPFYVKRKGLLIFLRNKFGMQYAVSTKTHNVTADGREFYIWNPSRRILRTTVSVFPSIRIRLIARKTLRDLRKGEKDE